MFISAIKIPFRNRAEKNDFDSDEGYPDFFRLRLFSLLITAYVKDSVNYLQATYRKRDTNEKFMCTLLDNLLSLMSICVNVNTWKT